MKNFKILMLNMEDGKGGAGIGAYRLHRGLLERGVHSRLIVKRKHGYDATVMGPNSIIGKFIYLCKRECATQLLRLQKANNSAAHSINVFPSNLYHYINTSYADIVHLHWIGHEMISISEIGKIKKPIVWRLADMWAFCGAEHITGHIHNSRFQEGYTRHNREKGSGRLDLDRWTWNRKMKHWSDQYFHVVASSTWLEQCARASLLFKNCPVYKIPNGIDVNKYKPQPREMARRHFDLSKEKFVILFLASSKTHKGLDSLMKALKKLPMALKSKIALAVFGGKSFEFTGRDIECSYFGYVNDDYTLSLMYSAADITIMPSLQESFGLVAAESLACGTPAVAYENTGVADLIRHKKNGYLARFNSPDDLCNGIMWLYDKYQNGGMRGLGEESRKTIVDNFNFDLQVDRYIQLYNNILDNQSSKKGLN